MGPLRAYLQNRVFFFFYKGQKSVGFINLLPDLDGSTLNSTGSLILKWSSYLSGFKGLNEPKPWSVEPAGPTNFQNIGLGVLYYSIVHIYSDDPTAFPNEGTTLH